MVIRWVVGCLIALACAFGRWLSLHRPPVLRFRSASIAPPSRKGSLTLTKPMLLALAVEFFGLTLPLKTMGLNYSVLPL